MKDLRNHEKRSELTCLQWRRKHILKINIIIQFTEQSCYGEGWEVAPAIHVPPPPVNRLNQENFDLVTGKNRNLDIFP